VAIPHDVTPRAVPRGATLQSLAGTTMGTSWSVKFYGTPAARQTLQRAIASVLDRVVAQMSPWLPDSTISRLNRAEVGEWMAIPAEFCAVTTAALRIAEATDGAFDPTVGAAVDAWGFGPSRRAPGLPTTQDIASNRNEIGWQRLELDADNCRVRRGAMFALDFNGIAKGYAVDLVMETLHRHGIHNGLVEIGGELSGAGIKQDGSPWWVDVNIQHPREIQRTAPALRIALHELAIATSGRERAFTHDGVCFSHTIDPRTAAPIASDTLSATVLHRSCMEADAYATAFMVMPPADAIATAARLGVAVLINVQHGNEITEAISAPLGAMLG